jgi:DNA topoisomerase-1
LKRDLRRPGLPREKVLAAIVTLLEQTLIRIGNEDYARTNHSFGLTTLRNRHVRVKGAELRFLFQGKSGKQWNLSLKDRRVARVIRSCQDLPGQHLFEYRGEDGAVRSISSSDVNAYLRDITGRDVSAKDFRTWAGTVKAAMAFRASAGDVSKKAVRGVIAAVADELGNTVAVCRKCYVHPQIIVGFEAGTLALRVPARGRGGLSAAECAVLAYLKRAKAKS